MTDGIIFITGKIEINNTVITKLTLLCAIVQSINATKLPDLPSVMIDHLHDHFVTQTFVAIYNEYKFLTNSPPSSSNLQTHPTMEILNMILSKLCFCFTSPTEDESSSRPWSNMPPQYLHHSFPRSSTPAQRDFIPLRDRSPIIKGKGHTKVQDVNFDDYSSTGTGTSGFVTASEGRWTSNVGGDPLRSYRSGNIPADGWISISEFDNILRNYQ